MSSRLLVLVFLCLSGIVLSGCSSKGGSGDAVAAAASRAGEQATVRIESTITLKSGDDSFVRHLQGEIDFEERAARLDVDEYGNEYEAVFDGNELLVRLPGEEWTPAWWADFEPGLVRSPRRIFSALEDSKGSSMSGNDTIRGAKTTRYSVQVDSETLFEATQVSVNAKRDKAPDLLAVDAWVDGDGLLRKIAYDFTFESSGDVVSVVVEFWDWGNAPAVEMPDLADIDDLLDSMGLGDIEDTVFGGEACYGERVAECLGVNPELDAITGDPADCTGPTARVCLVPVGFVRRDIVEAALKFHRETKGIEIVVLPSIALDASMVDADSSQVTENQLRTLMTDRYKILGQMPSSFIAITPFDMHPEDGHYGWFFGCRFSRPGMGQIDGVFSYFRMLHVEPYDGSGIDNALVFERVSKYLGRYVAVLHLAYPMGDDPDYLNYSSMSGFSDLDSIGKKWPEGASPCSQTGPSLCIIPDEDWDLGFQTALNAAIVRLSKSVDVRVEVRLTGGFFPSKDNWSEEFLSDLQQFAQPRIRGAGVVLVGVTDDAFAQAKSVAPHLDGLASEKDRVVISGYGTGKPGSTVQEERLYRLLLRAAARTVYGMPLSSDPSSLLYEGVDSPDDLDGLTLPVLKRP